MIHLDMHMRRRQSAANVLYLNVRLLRLASEMFCHDPLQELRVRKAGPGCAALYCTHLVSSVYHFMEITELTARQSV